jgi:hypothetical protein
MNDDLAMFSLVYGLLALVAIGKILVKAGYSPRLVLLTLVPVVNLLLPFVFAFAEWPIERRLRRAKERVAAATPPPG